MVLHNISLSCNRAQGTTTSRPLRQTRSTEVRHNIQKWSSKFSRCWRRSSPLALQVFQHIFYLMRYSESINTRPFWSDRLFEDVFPLRVPQVEIDVDDFLSIHPEVGQKLHVIDLFLKVIFALQVCRRRARVDTPLNNIALQFGLLNSVVYRLKTDSSNTVGHLRHPRSSGGLSWISWTTAV